MLEPLKSPASWLHAKQYMIMHFVESEFRTYEKFQMWDNHEIDDFKMTELKTFELAVSESD